MGQGSSRFCCFEGLSLSPPPSPGSERRSATPRSAARAEAAKLVLGPAPPGVAPLDPETHISGLATRKPLPPDILQATRALRRCLDPEATALVGRHAAWCTESTLVRFLIARDWNAEAAAKLLKEACRWRDRRKPDWVLSEPDSAVAQRFAKEAETGKIRVSGVDRYGRAVMVFDNTVENTNDDEWHMNFVAWNTMLTYRTMAPGVDKICLVLHLDRFSMRANPPLWVTRETIAMLTKGFPESLGTCILYQPPAAFMQFFNMVKYLIDPKPRSKIHFVKGDCSPGTPNHAKLCYLIGDNWQELTGCGLKPLERRYSEFHRREIDCSPGFAFERYWLEILARERAYAEAHAGALPARALEVDEPPEKEPLKSFLHRENGKPSGTPGLCSAVSMALAGMLVSVTTVNLLLAQFHLVDA